MESDKKAKTVHELELHETLELQTTVGGKMEITRVPGGWVYAFEYPGFRQSPIVFVPFSMDTKTSEFKKEVSKK